jgi:hypothetical protein
MISDTNERRKPRRKASPIKEILTENFLAVQTGIVCAVVFFIFGIIFGLKISKGSRRESSGVSAAISQNEAAPSRSDIPAGKSSSGADAIRNRNDLERATDAERQRHYEGVAERANQSGMRYNITPKDIKEGVEAFYSE